MRTEAKYREGLKELIIEKPLAEINVVSLCEYVGSNRQTFYYHYRDISDVIENIFLKEKIGNSRKFSSFEAITKSVISYVNTNYRFLYEVSKSYAADKISDFLYSFYYKNMISIYNTGKANHSTIIRYISTVASKEFLFWISTKRKEKSGNLLKRVCLLWDYLINRYEGELKKKQ